MIERFRFMESDVTCDKQFLSFRIKAFIPLLGSSITKENTFDSPGFKFVRRMEVNKDKTPKDTQRKIDFKKTEWK